MTDLDKRIYRAAARAAVVTGAPILTHLAIDAGTGSRPSSTKRASRWTACSSATPTTA